MFNFIKNFLLDLYDILSHRVKQVASGLLNTAFYKIPKSKVWSTGISVIVLILTVKGFSPEAINSILTAFGITAGVEGLRDAAYFFNLKSNKK